MQENLPEVPSVEQLSKFPWAAIAKFQFGVIVLLLVWILSQKGGLSDEQRKEYELAVAKANQKTFEVFEQQLKNNNTMDELRKQNKAYSDTIKMINEKVGMGLLPPAKKILNDEK